MIYLKNLIGDWIVDFFLNSENVWVQLVINKKWFLNKVFWWKVCFRKFYFDQLGFVKI